MPRVVVVTGGAGFIGANLAHHYLGQGDRVVLYDTLGRKGCRENLGWLEDHPNAANLEVLIGDVRLPTRPLQAAIERADALFHLAAQVAVTTSVSDPEYDFEVNALGTFKLLELVRNSRAKRPVVFYASTNKVYGGMEDVAIAEGQERYSYRDLPDGIPEDRLLDFHSPYGCSKGAADQYVRDYARIYGLETVVFRQSCIYGYRQFGLEDQGWVAWFIIAAILGRPITVFGDGKQVRDVLFIDDLIAAYDRAWARIESTRGQVYNVGGGPANAVSLRDLLAVLRAEVDPELAVAQAGWRPGDQPVYVSDVRRAAREFGWRPQVDWRSGVARLVDWVRDNRAMLERLF
ncbi:MAG: dTDP-D-glucose 4,6-dehydratase [Geminicoccaceae bacterium]|jgi:CDP-paratose 2-epimerase|nr:dTDP-D-glucose 4,6-dehydratase [Geminicoccaceae bacterium]